MKSFKSVCILLSLVLLTAGVANAQLFQVTVAASVANDNLDNPADLRDQCVGGALLPDGTPARFVKTAQGTPGDPRVAIGEVPSSDFGYFQQTFTLNGDFDLEMPGNFYTGDGLGHSTNTYGDSYRIEVMGPTVGGETLVWMSTSFTPTTGPNEIYRPAGTWTCEWRAGGCPTPLPPTNVDASDNLCGHVLVTWDAYVDTFTVDVVDSLFIYRDGNLVGGVQKVATSFSDTTGSVNQPFPYTMKARRVCVSPPEITYSPASNSDQGTRRPSPPVPQNVNATDNVCNTVTVTWSYTTNTGVDSFLIKRDGVQVGSVYRLATPGNMTFVHTTANGAQALYTVVGKNNICGEGTGASDNGTALQPPATAPTNVQATDGNCTQVTVTWNLLAGATGYHVYRCDSQGGNCTRLTATPLGPTIQSYVTSSGNAYTNYGYKVSAINTCGEGPQSPFDIGYWITVPGQVTGLTASFDTYCTHVALSWNNLDNETGYVILRGAAPYDSVAADVTTYNDNNATPGITYSYTVRAKNACGYGTASSPAQSGRRKAPPGQVANVQASDNIHCWGVQVTWNTLTADSFQIKRDGTRIGVALSGTSYDDATAAENTVYNYTVTAYNNCGGGTESASNEGSRKSRPPQVTGLSASDTSQIAIYLVWNDVAGEDSFRIIRDGTFLATTAANVTNYADNTASPGAYNYRVVAANTCGSGDTSAVAVGVMQSSLPAVTNVVASEDSCDYVKVTWDNIDEEDGYYISRNGELIDSVLANVTSFFDVTAEPWTTYGYSVAAFNQFGPGEESDVDSGYAATIPEQIPYMYATEDNCDSVFIGWTSINHVTTFHIYRDGAPLGTQIGIIQYFVDYTAVPGETYEYSVFGENACGAGLAAPSDEGGILVFPSVPENLSASDDLCDRIDLSWDASTGEADWYIIYRDGTAIDTIPATETTYSDDGTTFGQFDYAVSTLSDACGETEQSAAATGERLEEASQVQNVFATRIYCDRVEITWDAATGDVDGYIIYVDGEFLDSLDAITTDYTHTPAQTGVLYAYSVRAFSDQCGDGELSTPFSGLLLAYPSQVTGLTATVDRCDGVQLNWSASTGAVSGYIVRRDGTTLDTVSAVLLTTSYFDDTSPLGDSDYDVIAYSENCDDAAPSDGVTGTMLPEGTPPTDVAATTDRCDSVIVTWTASTGTFDYYQIYRDGVAHATVPAGVTTFGEAPTSGVTFRYKLTAVDDVCGSTGFSLEVDGLRQADAGVPENFAADGDCDGINLIWNTSTGIPEGYNVYRGPDAQSMTLLTTVLPPDTTYQDETERGITYVYAVSAFTSGCGETATSNTDTGMRLPLLEAVQNLTATDDVCEGILLSWDAMVGTEQYKIYRDDVLIDSVDGAARTNSYLDENVSVLEVHTYKVAAENICDVGAQSDPAEGMRYAESEEVTGLVASDTSCAAIYLVWDAAERANQYVIYRNGSELDTVDAPQTEYVDVLEGVQSPSHSYIVRGLNQCGLGSYATPVEGYRIPGVEQLSWLWASQDYCGGISISWLDLPNEDGYNIYRDGAFLTDVAADEQSYSDDQIDPGTSHYYSVSAFNVCGEGMLSDSVWGYRKTVPPQVVNLTATQDSCTSVTLTWDDVDTEWSYRVYRDEALIATLDPDVTEYRDEPLDPGAYTYTVLAANNCGDGELSLEAEGYVPDVPGVVQNLAATTEDCETVTVTWDDLPDEQNYELYRDDELIATLEEDEVSYVDAPEVGPHDYTIRALNYCGIGELSDAVTGERQGIPTEAPVIIVPDSACGEVTLTWTAIEDITGYIVFRDGIAIDTVDSGALSYLDSRMPGTYLYKVAGVNECGPGPDSNVEPVLFVPAPGQPTNLTATADHCDNVTLNWLDVENESGYYVFRAGAIVATLPEGAMQYVDVPDPGTYWYYVQAFNDCGSGLASDSVQGKRWAVPAQVTGVVASDTFCTHIVITWDNVADEDSFVVKRDGVPFGSTLADVLTLTDNDAAEGSTHAYTVTAYNRCGAGAESAPDNGYRATVPAQVIGVQATVNRCDSVVVTWADLTTETLYRIFRDGNEVGTAPQNATRFAEQPPVGTYQYTVRGENSCGNGTLSAPATGTRMQFPNPPTNVVASDTLCNQIVITWQSGGGDVDSFIVRRDGTRIAGVLGTVLTYTDAITGAHQYHVLAKSIECGESALSAPDSGHGRVLPSVPANLQFVTPVACDSIRLIWTASTGDVHGYYVRRDGVVIDTVTATAYTDAEVDDPNDYTYAVAAFNNYCGPTAFSAQVTGRMLPLVRTEFVADDTLECRDTLYIPLEHCTGVEADSFFISLNGGPFTYVTHASPVEDSIMVIIPETGESYVPNCRARVISYRGARVDTATTTDPFVIYCDLAADDLAGAEIPKDFMLEQNYPNPFNPSTTVRFGVPKMADVRIEVFDVLGRLVATPAEGTFQAGWHTIVWDCSSCPTGMYILRMNTDEKVLLRKMMLMK